MSNKNLTIDLVSRKDSNGQVFYVGKCKAPVLIDCSQGATFLIFCAEKGAEQLQIALMSSKEDD